MKLRSLEDKKIEIRGEEEKRLKVKGVKYKDIKEQLSKRYGVSISWIEKLVYGQRSVSRKSMT